MPENVELKGLRSRPKGGRKTTAAIKDTVLNLLEKGYTVADALHNVDRSKETWKYWRKTDPEFASRVDTIMLTRRRKPASQSGDNEGSQAGQVEVPDFPEFCEKYFGMRLFHHQLQWFDMLEGREPRGLHPSQRYAKGEETHLVINTPPNHAKSTTITVNYVLWRIMKDPNTQVLLVSKSHGMAKKWLTQIKNRMTNPRFADFIRDFAPEGGFEKNSTQWSADMIYFGPALRDADAKDPTIQALGIGGHIYGSRTDLIIMDDCVVKDNVLHYESQMEWIQGEVINRPGTHGRILVVGTRMAPKDLYSELLNADNYGDDESPWSYLSQPAVLEFDEDPAKWVTLWPKSTMPQQGDKSLPGDDGLYVMWDGERLTKQRKLAGPRGWALQYMQEEYSEDAIFPPEAVYGVVNKLRKIGPLDPLTPGHPSHGMDGVRVIAGLDPASSGHTAAVVVAWHRETGKRYLLDAFNRQNVTPDQLEELMLSWTQKYGVAEWRIEKVLLHQYITQNQTLIQKLANLGATMHEHITSRETKWDEDAGVMSLTALFKGWENKSALLEIPSTQTETVRRFCEQFVTYFPETKGKTDLLMAMWFVEARIRQFIHLTEGHRTMKSKWATKRDKARPMFRDKSAYASAQ